MVEQAGGDMIEVCASTPLAVGGQRDCRGLYARARAGGIRGFTGIDDPCDPPGDPEPGIDTSRCTVDEACQWILLELEVLGFVR